MSLGDRRVNVVDVGQILVRIVQHLDFSWLAIFKTTSAQLTYCKFVFCYYKIDGISELSTVMLAG